MTFSSALILSLFCSKPFFIVINCSNNFIFKNCEWNFLGDPWALNNDLITLQSGNCNFQNFYVLCHLKKLNGLIKNNMSFKET